MKRILIVLALFLTACTGEAGPTLPAEMSSALQARADAYDAQYPGNSDINVARLCLDAPIALYWNEGYQTYAVACEMPALSYTYGVVLLDANNKILNVEHLSAPSVNGFEDLLKGAGWERME